MDSKVIIIHGSAIVQNGLAEIIRNNFRFVVKTFYDFVSFSGSEKSITSKTIFFTDENISESKEYINFINGSPEFRSFTIVNSKQEKDAEPGLLRIFLTDTPDEIYEKVKRVIRHQELISEENEGLSNREMDVLKLVALGFSNKEIAEKLYISTHTVMSHRKNLTEKLGIKSISGLTVYAIINNYIDTTNLNLEDLI